MPALINSDDGVVSGSSGLKTTGANDGILALQNNGTTNVTVTAAGLVGVGTTSPNMNTNGTVLHINNSTASRAAVIHMTNAESGSGPADGLICGKWSDGTNYFFDYDNNPIIFGTNGTNRVTIDTSGRMTTPFQPAFRASIVTSNTVTPTAQRLSGSGLLTERFDIGGNFDSTTSRFTAPVAGIYCFGMFWAPTSTGRMNSFFFVNGTQAAIVSSANGGASFVVMLSLAANDYVEPWVQSSTGGNVSCDNSGELFGYLMG